MDAPTPREIVQLCRHLLAMPDVVWVAQKKGGGCILLGGKMHIRVKSRILMKQEVQ
jgi:hypothetical protein